MKSPDPKYLKLSLAFTGSYLFSICFVHLIPGVFSGGSLHIGYFILTGFFLQLVLEYFSEGIEHGHIHVHAHRHQSFPVAMMAGLCVHSFLEGMPLSAHIEPGEHHHSLFTGILLHHLPVAFALVSMLVHSGISKSWTLLNLALFALMAPAGAAFSALLGDSTLFQISNWYHEIMGVVIGIFLHISTTILFESSSDHRFNLIKLTTIVIGASVALFA
jgi:zinc transporter ZupT